MKKYLVSPLIILLVQGELKAEHLLVANSSYINNSIYAPFNSLQNNTLSGINLSNLSCKRVLGGYDGKSKLLGFEFNVDIQANLLSLITVTLQTSKDSETFLTVYGHIEQVGENYYLDWGNHGKTLIHGTTFTGSVLIPFAFNDKSINVIVSVVDKNNNSSNSINCISQ
jgi:hypothetical protein